MNNQPVSKDVIDHFLLRSVQALADEDEEGDVDAQQLYDHFRASFFACKEWSDQKVGRRLLVLLEHRFVTIKAPGGVESCVLHPDGPIAMVRITSAGEQALKKPPGQLKEGHSVTHKEVNFHGTVNAGNLATGDHSQQTVNVTLTLGDLLKAVGQAIEESPEITEEQKEEAKTLVEKIKENLPHAAQITTISNAAYGLINAGLGLLS